jgi:hypothetical protein
MFANTLQARAFLLCILGGFLFWLGGPSNSTAPHDQNLIWVFDTHRHAFTELRKMAVLDHLAYISAADFRGQITPARRRQYISLLKSINPNMTLVTDYDGTVRFIFAYGGISAISGGWLKGIEYVPGKYQNKGKIAQSLDNARAFPEGIYLKFITEHWFIVYQRTDN